jgi:hypothetical protein
MHVHDSLQTSGLTPENLLKTACRFIDASMVLGREIARRQSVQIFGSFASLRSQRHVAMRKSRQPRCTAANSMIAAADTLKPLDADQNFR